VKYAWIAQHQKHWPVSTICQVLGVGTSGYFEHLKPESSAPSTHVSEASRLAHIRIIHVQVKGEYGWRKVHKQLLAKGLQVGKERVRRLMQQHGIRARCKHKFVVTTDSKALMIHQVSGLSSLHCFFMLNHPAYFLSFKTPGYGG
jgi:putative transposase